MDLFITLAFGGIGFGILFVYVVARLGRRQRRRRYFKDRL